jgi:hypothetical protein
MFEEEADAFSKGWNKKIGTSFWTGRANITVSCLLSVSSVVAHDNRERHDANFLVILPF